MINTKDIKLDEEQSNVVKAIQEGKNICVNAVFGSGKTTTFLSAIENIQDKECVLITYNTHLKNEVLSKAEKRNLKNVQVHTYHSLCMKYFGYGKNDEELQIYHDGITQPKLPMDHIRVVLIDEIQDMTLILYTFIQKFLKCLSHMPIPPQIGICGDHLQGVYQFKGADKRFLTLGREIFEIDFESFQMTTSYRLTNSMGWFINECICGENILKTKKKGPPIILYNMDPYKCIYKITDYLSNLLKNGTENGPIYPEDIFILAPSLRCGAGSPLKKLENMIRDKLSAPVYYCTYEDAELNDKVIQNKIVFSTYHQSKGRERKIVIVFGFDESYYTFYAKDEDKTKCPTTIIVAISRAQEQLILVKNLSEKPLPFMKKNICQLSKEKEHIEIIGKPAEYEISKKKYQPIDNYKKTNVTDLVKYIKPDIQTIITDYKNQLFEKKTEVLDNVELETLITCKISGRTNDIELCEDTSDLIGILLPSIFEEFRTGRSVIKEFLKEKRLDERLDPFLRERLNHVNLFSTRVEDLLYMVKVYKSINDGIYSRFQLDRNDWLSKDQMSRIVQNILHHIVDCESSEESLKYESLDWEPILATECDFQDNEKPIYYDHPELGKILLKGRMDCRDDEYVWEFKCVRELSLEHFLQVICYQWLWNLCLRKKYGSRVFRLLNIRTGEMYELGDNQSLIDDVMNLLFLNRYEKMFCISDEEFVQSCLDIKIKN
jgi:hypothetical protein